jgi:hypothetical protein
VLSASVVDSKKDYSNISEEEEEYSRYKLGDRILAIVKKLSSKRADGRIYHGELILEGLKPHGQGGSSLTLVEVHLGLRYCIHSGLLHEVENAAVTCYIRWQTRRNPVYATPEEIIEMRRHSENLDRENTRQEFKNGERRRSSKKPKKREVEIAK